VGKVKSWSFEIADGAKWTRHKKELMKCERCLRRL
jgi:hypothetical protein